MAASWVGVVTDAEKQVLLDRYLDIVWCEDVSEVECVRCHRVPIQHYMSNCQHLFCRNCKTVFSNGGRWKCPQCQAYVTQLSDQDWQLEDRIYQIEAHCPNKKYGCHYQGQLSTIPEHLRSCENTREAALPVEFTGISLEIVDYRVTKLNDSMEGMRREVKELKDRCDTNLKQSETMDNWLRAEMNILTQNLNVQQEQMVNVKQILKAGVKEREARDALEMQQLRTQLEQQQTLINTKIEQMMKQLSSVETRLKGVMDGTYKAGKCNQRETQL